MSAVFMCDNCGEMFSANAKGWRQFSESWDGRDSSREQFNNAHNHGMCVRHIGPCCALSDGQPKPRLALPPTKDDAS